MFSTNFKLHIPNVVYCEIINISFFMSYYSTIYIYNYTGVKFIEFDIDNQRAFVTSSISSDEMFAALQTTKKDCSYLGRCQVV